jgi:hypothetical protein
MDENNLEKLRELVEFLKANEIAEFETERAEGKLRSRRLRLGSMRASWRG